MTLRPYQSSAIQAARDLYSQGHRRICLVAPTGSGKTVIGAAMTARAVADGRPVLWVAHRSELLDQARAVLPPSVQVESCQTLVARGIYPAADLVVLDECFPAGTAVATPRGDAAIEAIKAGDEVICFDHLRNGETCGTVARTFKRALASKTLVSIEVESGERVLCTPEHPVFCEGSYKAAICIKVNDLLHMRGDIRVCVLENKDDLLERMQVKEAFSDDVEDEQTVRCVKDDSQESNGEQRDEGKTIGILEKDGAQTTYSGRKWKGGDTTRNDTAGCSWGRMGVGRYSKNALLREGHTASLQAGFVESRDDDCHRSRREQPLRDRASGAGCEEDARPRTSRVVRVEVQEQGSGAPFDELCDKGWVYNLEIAKHENYFANGILVHNCHHYAAAEWSSVASAYRDAIVIGLTATPERSDGVGLRGIFDALVPVAQPRELIAAGHLVPVHVYGPRQRLRGAIAGDPAAYCTDGTIVFSASVEDAQALAGRVPGAVCVDGGMSASDREAAITGFRDGRIPVLTNVFVLTEGFDAPRASVCVLARGCSSAGAYIQMVGRVMRADTGKTHATVYDLSGACHQHGLPDDDRVYSLDGTAIRASGEAAVALRQCRKCGATFRSVETTCPRCGAYCVVPRTLAQRKLDIERIRETATPESRSAWLDRLRSEASAKGYSYGWVCHRYKARFGCWPGR